MPWNEVMGKFGKGQLHSGSKSGKPVTDPKQAEAIMYSEKGGAKQKPEYRASLKGLKKAAHIGT